MATIGGGDWAQLPDNLVEDISQRLPIHSAITMGHVCKPWRHVLADKDCPLTRRQGVPWLVLAAHNQCEERPCFSILQKNFWSLQLPDALGKYCWGSVQDWLIIANKSGRTLLEIHLLNPFSGAKLLLPSITDRYTKLILSAPPDDPNCLFLLVGTRDQSIACWTPGLQTWRTKDALDDLAGAFADAVFCDGRFYFVTHDYNLQTLDAQPLISAIKQDNDCCTAHFKLHLHQVTIPDRPTWPSHPVRPYLVESCGEVLMVCRLFLTLSGTHRETHGFELFKLDARQKLVWTKMQGLGDRVLFIGKSDSRSFSAKDLGDDAANRIYFFNDFFTFGVNEWTKSSLDTTTPPIRHSTFMDWGSFSMDTKCFVPTGSNRGSRQTYPPIWITAPIWWFFTVFSTNKHQRVNVARRTGQPVKWTGQQEQNNKYHRPLKRRRMVTVAHH